MVWKVNHVQVIARLDERASMYEPEVLISPTNMSNLSYTAKHFIEHHGIFCILYYITYIHMNIDHVYIYIHIPGSHS